MTDVPRADMRTEKRLSPIVDSLPTEMIVREWPDEYPGTYASWAESIGHPVNDRGRCKTCGLAITCPLRALWDALISTVVREVDKLYTIHRRPPAAHLCVCSDSVHSGRTCPTRQPHGCPREGESGKTFRERCMEKWGARGLELDDLPDEEPDLNHEDVLFVFGSSPSYRCYVSRHEDCEDGPGEPEDGCTCACHGGPREVSCGALADHDPHGECWGNGPFRKDLRQAWLTERRSEAGLCTCSSREIDEQGNRLHYAECAQALQDLAFHEPLDPELKKKIFAKYRKDCPGSISGTCLQLSTQEKYICDTEAGECVAEGIPARERP